ncbi:MAG TPA: HNH endonuclease signature motif containing protein [Candidatus Obscuribacterales bacterium]
MNNEIMTQERSASPSMSQSYITVREKKLSWQRNQRRKFALKHGFSSASNYSAGGSRGDVLRRDDYKCIKCFMTDDEHRKIFGRPITIDHKDRNRKNNSMENLQTLCLRCHGQKDILPRLKVKKFLPFLEQAKSMRQVGNSYQAISDALGFSTATVWKYLNNKTKEQSYE